MAFQRDEYEQLKKDLNSLRSGSISDEKLKKMWQEIEQEEREAEQKARAHSAWLVKRQQKQEPSSRESGNLSTPKKSHEISCEPAESFDDTVDVEEEKKNQGGRSPLLTSLLKSPSPTTQVLNAPSTAQTTSPTIASLLGATTKSQTSQVSQNLTAQLQQIAVSSVSSPIASITSLTSMSGPVKEERPSVGAPTLSMMLQLPSNIPKNLPTQQHSNLTPIASVVPASPIKTIKTVVTEQIPQTVAVSVAQTIDNSVVQIVNPIANVATKETITEPIIDKDEINEIIDDIEELIKEEISPEIGAASIPTVELNDIASVEDTVNQKEIATIEKPESPSKLPPSEMEIELIQQDSSQIAEIIGTSIKIEPKTSPQPVEPEKPAENEDDKTVDKEDEEKKQNLPEVLVQEKPEIIKNDEKEAEIVFEETKAVEEQVEEINEVDTKENKVESDYVVEEKKIVDTPKEDNDEKQEKVVTVELVEEPIIEVEKIKTTEELKVEEKNEALEEKITEEIKPPQNSDEELKIETDPESVPTIKEPEKTEEVELVECPEEKSENDKTTSKEEIIVEVKDDVDELKNSSQAEDQEIKEEDLLLSETEADIAVKESNECPSEPEKIKKEQEETTVPEISIQPVESTSTPEKSAAQNSDTPELPDEKKIDVKIIKIKQDDKATDIEQKIPHSKIPIKMQITEEKKMEITVEKVEKVIKEEEKKDVIKEKKQEVPVSTVDDTEEEETSMTKLSGRAIKTYSKKQHIAIDSEPETESSEGADYRAWKKAIILVFNRLATHKYASLFLKPITEENAPGYHSVVFRPMDLSTIKKNIDNGTIRSTIQFQRDVMLMFQNAIMYNKHDTAVYKMAVSMQEECLEQMQVMFFEIFLN